MAGDIVNLRMAAYAEAPVILVADIDRGGVFASIVGTVELLAREERQMLAGVIINRFRGDPALLAPGIAAVEARTGVPVLGVVPWLDLKLPEEDSVGLARKGQGRAGAPLRIGVVRLPRLANYTDFDPLEWEEDLALSFIDSPELIAGLDLLILPGSKSTISDLLYLKTHGFFPAIKKFTGEIAGICGGFQMLGRRVSDPDGVESAAAETEGLALLDAVTVMMTAKETHQAVAEILTAGLQVAPKCARRLEGYEIHMGETILGKGAEPFAHIISRSGREVEVLDGEDEEAAAARAASSRGVTPSSRALVSVAVPYSSVPQM